MVIIFIICFQNGKKKKLFLKFISEMCFLIYFKIWNKLNLFDKTFLTKSQPTINWRHCKSQLNNTENNKFMMLQIKQQITTHNMTFYRSFLQITIHNKSTTHHSQFTAISPQNHFEKSIKQIHQIIPWSIKKEEIKK